MSEQLPDSGGAYLDRDAASPLGLAKRIVRSGKKEIISGDIGGDAVSVSVGVVVGGVVAGWFGMNR